MTEEESDEQKHDGEYYFREGCYITELSNSSEDPVVSIARARVTPGVSTKWHCLRRATERYCILSGEGRMEVGKQPPRHVVADDVVIIRPGERQRITNTGQQDLIFLAFCSPRFMDDDYVDLGNV